MGQTAIQINTLAQSPWRPSIQLRAQSSRKPHFQLYKSELIHAAKRVAPIKLDFPWQEKEAKRWLIVFCEWLDEQLANPIRSRSLGIGVRRIKVLGVIAYVIDTIENGIYVGEWRDGKLIETAAIFEIGRPLITSKWLQPVLEHAGILREEQGDLFFGGTHFYRVKNWMADTAYRLLERDPRFLDLRRRALPKALGLPADIYRLAMASRTHSRGPLLDSRTFNTVWRNQRAFRQVARENPQLLSLLQAFLSSKTLGWLKSDSDPVATLKDAFRRDGFSEAAWRYVVKHGSRLFQTPWAISTDTHPFHAAAIYLRMLETAGLAPPPPPVVAKAFLHGYNSNRGKKVRLEHGFHENINPLVMRAALHEADRERRNCDLVNFAETFLGVFWWAEDPHLELDKNQVKAGWPWMVKQWEIAERGKAIAESDNAVHWTTRLTGFWIGQWLVLPISSSLELLQEAMAMRNCLADFQPNCEAGEVEIYSVRDAVTRKRKACIGIRFDMAGSPHIFDVRGFANTPPSGDIQHVANITLRRLLKSKPQRFLCPAVEDV
jgi:hypothetical protein